jgi:hypothetical protein
VGVVAEGDGERSGVSVVDGATVVMLAGVVGPAVGVRVGTVPP